MQHLTLADLGWSAHFLAQLTPDEVADPPVARITSVARDRLIGRTPKGERALLPKAPVGDYAVGDWVRIDAEGRALDRLSPKTELVRRQAGTGAARQLIASNVDTLGIVTSCNQDFNPARLERYLALASSAGCLPLVILTKADLADDASQYRRTAERLSPLVTALALDARTEADALHPWCDRGQTLALVGSSGVGKTTLQNALTGQSDTTQGIRDDDAKGRHTTTARALRPALAGGWIVDTPGMRALRLTDAADGVRAVFANLEELARTCRFTDCSHGGEPGCAIQAGIDAGEIEAEQVTRWQKLLREDQYNSETIAEARARGKAFGRMVKDAMSDKRRRRDRG